MDEDDVLSLFATQIQALGRRFLVRLSTLSILNARYEKIWDPRKKKFFYYDKETDKSSWEKPLLLLNKGDIRIISPTYNAEEALVIIQCKARMNLSLHRVRVLYQQTIKSGKDMQSGRTYYVNPKNGRTMWELPHFMANRLNYGTHRGEISANTKKKFKREAVDDDSFDNQSDEGLSEDSHVLIERRRLRRIFPRSKVQSVVDTVEDNMDSTLTLDLSGINAKRFTSRMYDFSSLTDLNMSSNRLRKLSEDIQYLSNLTSLDISWNRISKIPKEIDELVKLCEFKASHNLLSTYPGHFYKLRSLRTLDMSHNPFETIPIETGNLELLKDLNQWDVGVGVLSALTSLDFSHCLISEWPPQVEQLARLTSLNFSVNNIEIVPAMLSSLTSLQTLNLSNNRIHTVTAEVYHKTISVLQLQNNEIAQLPDCSDPQNHVMSMLSEINLSNNKILILDNKISIFARAERFDASHNCIASLAENISNMKQVKYLDLSHNELRDIPAGLSSCIKLNYVDFSYNKLSSVPVSLSGTNRVTDLNLSYNEIVDVSGKVFGLMVDLQHLQMQHNKVSVLPPLFYSLRKLELMDLSHNKLNQFEEIVSQMKSLRLLYLQSNKLKSIPATIGSLTKLTILELAENKLTDIPLTITNLKSLKRISMNKNNLTQSPSLIGVLPYILNCDLSWNLRMPISMKPKGKMAKEYKYKTEFISIDILKFKLQQAEKSLDMITSKPYINVLYYQHELSKDTSVVIDTPYLGEADEEEIEEQKAKLKAEKMSSKPIEGSKSLEATHKWFVQIQDYFNSLFVFVGDDDKAESHSTLASLEALTTELISQNKASERLRHSRLQLKYILLCAEELARGPPEVSLNHYVKFESLLESGITDDDDDSVLSILQSLDLGFELQDVIESLQRCAHETTSLLFMEELTYFQSLTTHDPTVTADIVPTSSDHKSKRSHVKGDRSTNSLTLKKSSVINFGELPYIFNFFPAGVSSKGVLAEVISKCYLSLAKALLSRCDVLRDSIRDVEIRGRTPASCLDLAQRRGSDFIDLIRDYYDELADQALTAGSIDTPREEDDDKMAAKAKKINLVESLTMTLTGTEEDNDAFELGSQKADNDGGSITDESISSVSVVAEDPGKKKKGKSQKNKQKNKQKDKKKSKPEVVKPIAVPVEKPKRNITLKEMLRKIDASFELISPIPTNKASECASYLFKLRHLTLLWASKCLDAVTELLSLNGWNAITASIALTRRIGKREEWMPEAISEVHLLRARMFAGLRRYSEAECELKTYILLTPSEAPRTVQLHLIKVLMTQGNYFLAQKEVDAMVDILYRAGKLKASKSLGGSELPSSSPDFNILHIIKLDKELGLLKFVVDNNVVSLKENGVFSSEQVQMFRVKDNGLLQMDLSFVAPECLNGRSLRDRATADRHLERSEQEAKKFAEEQAREDIDSSIKKAIERCRNVMKESG